jgi:hypothetical protein
MVAMSAAHVNADRLDAGFMPDDTAGGARAGEYA